MDESAFKEALLEVMEHKDHWAWAAFGNGAVAADLLHVHFEQEYEVYVRDFPVLMARAYVECPVAEVRRELAENIYEEETGGLSAGHPHPKLFLRYPAGLAMNLERFDHVELLPGARAYRDFLDASTAGAPWEIGAAVTTLFVEGTRFERGEIDPAAAKRPVPPLEDHPLVKHYGLPLEDLALTKAHRAVEGEHRAAAWRVMLNHVAEAQRQPVVDAMKTCLAKWLAYRDDVAEACGVCRD
ncbi:MAG: iron-containing redox enzyme family protein [Deltaproteobacteria bacterium]|nr:iron-containing redox enzyme family protein [Deltaproteobacteria bacterium]